MRIALLFLLLLTLAACGTGEPTSELSPVQQRIIAAVHEVDSLRSARAATIGEEEIVDFETFARVCQPAGLRIRQFAQENGWRFRQVSVRNRNPVNVPDSAEYVIYQQFQDDPALDSLWTEAEEGIKYFHRITVEPACLHCHGDAASRPKFVFERYPDDRAYGFESGDLRGLYIVTAPDSVSRI